MPSFADSIFLFILALLLFGPKKLPVLARELGKWMGEFRRASNEFKMQMDEELRASEQADRQKQIAAMEAAAPVPPPLSDPAEPEHPHLRHHGVPASPEPPDRHLHISDVEPNTLPSATSPAQTESDSTSGPAASAQVETTDGARPVPIAVSGNLKMMPPDTGLPAPRSSRPNAVAALVDAIPETSSHGSQPSAPAPDAESVAHAD